MTHTNDIQTIGDPSAKKKIFIGTNVLTAVDSCVYDDHLNNFYQWGKSREFFVYRWAPRRQSIDRMRNMSAKYALRLECDYLMFIDDDNMLSPGTLESLIKADLDICMADTIIRGYPFHSMSFKGAEKDENGEVRLEHFDDIMDHVDDKGIAMCEAVGFSTVLIKCELLKQMNEPYFCTTPNGTEDVYFCIRCKQEIGPQVKIGVDTKVPTYHQMDPLFATRSNIAVLKEMYEKLQLSPKPNPEDHYRANDYYKMVSGL